MGRLGVRVSASSPTLLIRADGRGRPQGVTVRDCRIFGAIRIWGLGAGGDYDELRAASRRADFTAYARAMAPSDIRLEGLRLHAQGSIPLYVGPGVTGVRLERSTFTGQSDAVAVYLDAESGFNQLIDNDFRTRTGREAIAVDGSSDNRIERNRFQLNGRPGVLLYRNCGERGVIRHQTPSRNRIVGNLFRGASWWRPRLVVENARQGRRSYCDDDAGFPFGSSADDRDGGVDNVIAGNVRR